MHEKQKVTLYLPPNLHRQLKIRAAIDSNSMSSMVEKALGFYLNHPEIVESNEEAHGKTHQVHICPECNNSLVMKDGELSSLKNQPSVITEEFPINVGETKEEEELVAC